MTDKQIEEIALRCVEIIRRSTGLGWDEDVRRAVRKALVDTQAKGEVRQGFKSSEFFTLDERVTALESKVGVKLGLLDEPPH